MCMEDIRLGRALGGYSTSIPLADATQKTLSGNNLNRTRIHMSAQNGATCVVGPMGTSVATGVGILLNAGHPTHTFTVEEWGDLLFGAWVGAGVGGALNLYYSELTLERQ